MVDKTRKGWPIAERGCALEKNWAQDAAAVRMRKTAQELAAQRKAAKEKS